MSDFSGVPDGPLDDLAYLSRSESRIEILGELSAGSYSRGELEAETGVPRTTVDRVVNELEERGWVQRTPEGEYEATPVGERVDAETTQFVGSMEAVRTLGDAVSWLPHDELTVGLHHFREASVRRPEPNDMSAPTSFATELLQEATEFTCLVNTPPSPAFEDVMIEGRSTGRLSTEHVINTDGLDAIRTDPNRASRWAAYVEAGADIYRFEGEIPCNLLVIDESTLILDRRPAAAEGIVCTEPVVRSWAHGLISDYRADAERVAPTVFR